MTKFIKGYLPVKLSLPSYTNPNEYQTTFLFLKQHNLSTSNTTTTSNASSNSCTIFVVNAPFYPFIRTNILLQRIFERFGDVEKVVVVSNPRKYNTTHQEDVHHPGVGISSSNSNNNNNMEYSNCVDYDSMTMQMFEKEIRSIGGQGTFSGMGIDELEWYTQGKFAHVTFTTNKEMKNVFKAFERQNIHDKSTKNNNQKRKSDASTKFDKDGSIKFDFLEIQELQEISRKLFRKEGQNMIKNSLRPHDDDDDDDDSSSDEDGISGYGTKDKSSSEPTGIIAMLQYCKDRIPARASLKAICDKIMSKYEQEEEAARLKQIAATQQPDEDGFITVSYSASVGDKVRLEESDTAVGNSGGDHKGAVKRREGLKRNRSNKKKTIKGSDELKDFYRFQLKETRKRHLDDIKARFQDDLKRVKQMKEEKMYLPFAK